VKNAEEKEGEEKGEEGSHSTTRSIEACLKFVFFLFSL
jgi:hypothetical protein